MTTFVFILLVTNSTGPDSTFVIDYGLTEIDCFELVEQWQPTLRQMNPLSNRAVVFCEEES